MPRSPHCQAALHSKSQRRSRQQSIADSEKSARHQPDRHGDSIVITVDIETNVVLCRWHGVCYSSVNCRGKTMRHVLALTVLGSFVVFSSAAELYAQGRGAGRPQGAKPQAVRGGKVPQGHGPRTTAAPRAPKTKTAGPKVKASAPKAASPTRAPAATRADNGKKATAPRTPATLTTTAPALPKNPRLVERLRTLLPAGTDMTTAASGFRNQGQFVAAVHVSNNLGLSFAELKTRMVDQNLSLGQAIQQLRPGLNASDAARRAATQADVDLAAPSGSRPNPRR
jgi:hypothetical protein